MLMMLFVAGLAEGTVATDADDAVPAGILMWMRGLAWGSCWG